MAYRDNTQRSYRWNSASWDEFARKWNKPVHAFLLRHVYASTLASGRFSKQSAMTLTFFLSAAVHELVMAVVTKKIRYGYGRILALMRHSLILFLSRMYLFVLQVMLCSCHLFMFCSLSVGTTVTAHPNPTHRGWSYPCDQAE